MAQYYTFLVGCVAMFNFCFGQIQQLPTHALPQRPFPSSVLKSISSDELSDLFIKIPSATERGHYFEGDIAVSFDEVSARYGREVAEQAQREGRLVDETGRLLRGVDKAVERDLGIFNVYLLRWERVNGTVFVPYAFAVNTFTESERALIESAIEDIVIRSNNLFNFVQRTNEENYIEFQSGGGGCFSFVGKQFIPAQPINLDPGCRQFGIIQHEILHAMGFFHEQSRPDRDQFVTVNFQNIELGFDNQFASAAEFIDSLRSPYDYGR